MYEYSATVTRIVDADTVEMIVDLGFKMTTKGRFRIKGFDAPETWRPKCKEEKEHGELATKFASGLLLNKKVIIKTDKDPIGIYGRYVAEVFLEDGSNFANIMINEGFQKRDDYGRT